LNEMGISNTNWNLTNWDSKSMKIREDMYCALLRNHLTT